MATGTKAKTEEQPAAPEAPKKTYEIQEVDTATAEQAFQRRRRTVEPSPLEANVQASLDNQKTYAISADDEEAAKRIENDLKKAARHLSNGHRRVSVQVKTEPQNKRVVFRAKAVEQ